jgi:hypothetical protein
MPNYIKYSTTIPSGSLKKGNAALGIADSVAGPTSTTGWYSGINPQSSSYVVYEVAASGDPDIYCPQNTTELLNLVKSKGATGGNTGSVAAALAWIATQNNLLAINEVYPNIITSGSVLMLDAGFVGSYPTTSSIWYDVSGNNNSGSLLNNPTFNPNGSIVFDGIDDLMLIPDNSDLRLNGNFTINLLHKAITMVNTYPGPIYKGNSGPAGTSYIMFYTTINNGDMYFKRQNQTFTLPNGVNTFWKYITFTYDGNSIKGYVNGTLGATFSSITFPTNTDPTPLYLGKADDYGNGAIANLGLYNRALSQAEILQNYYQAPIVTNGLVFAVDAGNLVSYESGSIPTYSLTGSVSGSLINGVSYNSGNNGSWVFDGVDDNIDFGDVTTTEFGTGDFTLSAWIYIPTNVVENINFFKGIIVKKGASAAQAGYAMYYNTGQQKFLWSTANGTLSAERFSTNTWGSLKGTWANVVMVRQNGATNNGHFYINGVYESIASSATVVDVNGDFNLRLGSGNLFGNYFFQGNIADAKIYNRALSATEASQNFNAQKTRFGL